MNITLSADAALIQQAREIAARQGTSLNEMVREYLRSVVGQNRAEGDPAAELLMLLETTAGRSGGKRFRREDAYEGR